MHSIVGPDMLSGEGGEEQRLMRERFACVYAVVLIMDWNGGAPAETKDEGRQWAAYWEGSRWQHSETNANDDSAGAFSGGYLKFF